MEPRVDDAELAAARAHNPTRDPPWPASLDELMARRHVQAALAAARNGYGTARVDLRDAIPVHAIDGVLRMYEYEGSRAAATERAVALVERALAGERWPARPPRTGSDS
ncbi:hypothetical protein [Embleya sp. NPDC059237]|uniref:hypothetical protein n=1 Tax=Embleya sp. NPDC059237 TaxID=3346784 RepID=UPI0036D184D6